VLSRAQDQGDALSPTKQYEFLEAHPELFSLPKKDENGGQPVIWQWTAAQDSVEAEPGTSRTEPLFELAEAMCRGKAGGVRIAPVEGAAVLLETSKKGAKGKVFPDWMMWHAGCSPASSSQRRWTAQIFFDAASANPGHKEKPNMSEL